MTVTCLITIPGFIHSLRETPIILLGFHCRSPLSPGDALCCEMVPRALFLGVYSLWEIWSLSLLLFPFLWEQHSAAQQVLLKPLEILKLKIKMTVMPGWDLVLPSTPRWSVCFWKLPLIHRAKECSNLMVLFSCEDCKFLVRVHCLP